MNKVFLIGNLTRDPEYKTTQNNISLCTFDIAVSRRYNSDETDYFHIQTWRSIADNCKKFLQKGNKVAIIGSIQNRTFEMQDGSKRTTCEIIAEDIQFLTPKNNDVHNIVNTNSTPSQPDRKQEVQQNIFTPVDDDEQLPF